MKIELILEDKIRKLLLLYYTKGDRVSVEKVGRDLIITITIVTT